MSKLSVEMRDTYLKLLETTAGPTVTVNLNNPEEYPNNLDNILQWLPADSPDDEYESEKFVFVKRGNVVDITANHVYQRFLNGERWNRAGVGGEPPTLEELKALHGDKLTDKVKFKGEPKRRGRPAKPKDENAAPKERKSRRKKNETDGAKSADGPKPVEDDEDTTPEE